MTTGNLDKNQMRAYNRVCHAVSAMSWQDYEILLDFLRFFDPTKRATFAYFCKRHSVTVNDVILWHMVNNGKAA